MHLVLNLRWNLCRVGRSRRRIYLEESVVPKTLRSLLRQSLFASPAKANLQLGSVQTLTTLKQSTAPSLQSNRSSPIESMLSSCIIAGGLNSTSGNLPGVMNLFISAEESQGFSQTDNCVKKYLERRLWGPNAVNNPRSRCFWVTGVTRPAGLHRSLHLSGRGYWYLQVVH